MLCYKNGLYTTYGWIMPFGQVVECSNIYLLYCFLLDQKVGRISVDFLWNHPTLSKPRRWPKMHFTARYQNTTTKNFRYSTPSSTFFDLSKWHDPHIRQPKVTILIIPDVWQVPIFAGSPELARVNKVSWEITRLNFHLDLFGIHLHITG